MADTIVTNTPARDEDSSALGWIVALIVVLAVVVAGFVWYQRGAEIPNTGTNINVEVPTPSVPTDVTPDLTPAQ
jgi:hypothetical protein